MSKEKEIFTKNFAKFCNILRDEDSLLPHFVEKQIISVGDLTDIRSKPYTDKASTLLRHISSPLDIGYTKGFYDLLDIMIDYGRPHTKDFAEKIKHQCSNYSDGAELPKPDKNDQSKPDYENQHNPDDDDGLMSFEDLKNLVEEKSYDDLNEIEKDTIQILLVTANQTEYFAALACLDPLKESSHLLKYHYNDGVHNALYILGKFGYFNAAVFQMTKQGPLAAQLAVIKAQYCFGNSLNAIFAVGVACGVEGKSKMLDVLVSEKISVYTEARVSTTGVGDDYVIENRGVCNMPMSNFLFTYFNQPPLWSTENSKAAAKLPKKPRVLKGNILSGNYLVDNKKFKQLLLNTFGNDAIGIEMEGAGLIHDHSDRNIKIMVIKAVCDFGDGKKDKTYQPAAAMLAVECLKHYIGNSPTLPQNLRDHCGNKGNTQPPSEGPLNSATTSES